MKRVLLLLSILLQVTYADIIYNTETLSGTLADTTHAFLKNITVPLGDTLTITAGATVKVMNQNNGITVEGTLIIAGTEAKPVSIKNDSVVGYWQGISFTPQATGTISFLNIDSAGTTGGNSNAAIYIDNAEVTLQNVSITNVNGTGIHTVVDSSGTAQYSNISVYNASKGIYIESDSLTMLTNVSIDSILGTGIHVLGSSILERCTVTSTSTEGMYLQNRGYASDDSIHLSNSYIAQIPSATGLVLSTVAPTIDSIHIENVKSGMVMSGIGSASITHVSISNVTSYGISVSNVSSGNAYQLSNLILENSDSSAIGIYGNVSHPFIVQDSKITGFQTGVSCGACIIKRDTILNNKTGITLIGDDGLFEQNYIAGNWESGIAVGNYSALFKRNIVYKNAIGVSIENSSASDTVTVVHNTILENSIGVSISATAENFYVMNNIIWSTQRGIQFASDNVDIGHNLLFGDSAFVYNGGSITAAIGLYGVHQGASAIHGDSIDAYNNSILKPLFTDSISGDFKLLASSPGIDAGDTTYSDIITNTYSDIGPHEIGPARLVLSNMGNEFKSAFNDLLKGSLDTLFYLNNYGSEVLVIDSVTLTNGMHYSVTEHRATSIAGTSDLSVLLSADFQKGEWRDTLTIYSSDIQTPVTIIPLYTFVGNSPQFYNDSTHAVIEKGATAPIMVSMRFNKISSDDSDSMRIAEWYFTQGDHLSVDVASMMSNASSLLDSIITTSNVSWYFNLTVDSTENFNGHDTFVVVNEWGGRDKYVVSYDYTVGSRPVLTQFVHAPENSSSNNEIAFTFMSYDSTSINTRGGLYSTSDGDGVKLEYSLDSLAWVTALDSSNFYITDSSSTQLNWNFGSSLPFGTSAIYTRLSVRDAGGFSNVIAATAPITVSVKPGDFTGDGIVSLDDFTEMLDSLNYIWYDAQNTTMNNWIPNYLNESWVMHHELYPFTGALPNITVQGDSLFNAGDLAVFTRSWSADSVSTLAAQKTRSDNFDITLHLNDGALIATVSGKEFSDIAAFDISFNEGEFLVGAEYTQPGTFLLKSESQGVPHRVMGDCHECGAVTLAEFRVDPQGVLNKLNFTLLMKSMDGDNRSEHIVLALPQNNGLVNQMISGQRNVTFSIDKSTAWVRYSVYTALGQIVFQSPQQLYNQGEHTINWMHLDYLRGVPGVSTYFVELEITQ